MCSGNGQVRVCLLWGRLCVLAGVRRVACAVWTGRRAGAAAMAVRACSACLHVEKKMCTMLCNLVVVHHRVVNVGGQGRRARMAGPRSIFFCAHGDARGIA